MPRELTKAHQYNCVRSPDHCYHALLGVGYHWRVDVFSLSKKKEGNWGDQSRDDSV